MQLEIFKMEKDLISIIPHETLTLLRLDTSIFPRNLAKPIIIINEANLNGNGNENLSQYKSRPNPFSEFKFKKPENSIRKNVIMKEKKLSHLYDRHAKPCYNTKEPRNKQTLIIFENKLRNYLESYEQINGSWKSQIPAYNFFEPIGSLVLSVNATDNSFIGVRNVSEIQVLNLRQDGNLGLDITSERRLRDS